jgi:hypothetical protein
MGMAVFCPVDGLLLPPLLLVVAKMQSFLTSWVPVAAMDALLVQPSSAR